MADLRRDALAPRSPGGFRTIWLNVYGWSALIATGSVAGVLIALLSPLPLAGALLSGLVATWVLVLLLDRRRHLNSTTSLGDNRLDRDNAAAIVKELEEHGLSATYEELIDEDDEGVYTQRAISCRQRHAIVVRQIMTKHLVQ